jgi:hypothetical protein
MRGEVAWAGGTPPRSNTRLDTHFRAGYCTSLAQKRPLLT